MQSFEEMLQAPDTEIFYKGEMMLIPTRDIFEMRAFTGDFLSEPSVVYKNFMTEVYGDSSQCTSKVVLPKMFEQEVEDLF